MRVTAYTVISETPIGICTAKIEGSYSNIKSAVRRVQKLVRDELKFLNANTQDTYTATHISEAVADHVVAVYDNRTGKTAVIYTIWKHKITF